MKSVIAGILALNILLSGCVAVVVAGAAAGLILYDKRSVTSLESDSRIFHRIHTAVVSDPQFKDSRVEVISFNQVVLLLGQTPTLTLKTLAGKISQNTPSVRRVYNEITVANPISFSKRSKDGLITSQVRTMMLRKKGLESGSIRIVTENKVVYLMGIATHEQADLAVEVARHVQGVQKVIKVFQYIV